MQKGMFITMYRGKHRAAPRYGEAAARRIGAGAAWIAKKWRRLKVWLFESVAGKTLLGAGAAMLLWAAIAAIAYAYVNPSVSSGVVVDKAHRAASDYQMTWTFGNWSVVRNRHEPESYSVQVKDGNHLEWWEVGREEWLEINEGDYLKKKR